MELKIPLELVNETASADDTSYSFMPTNFDEYIGQKVVKEKLQLYVQASKMRKEHLDHLLLFGPPGLGKTTLAQVMAHELGVPLKITSGPVLERTGDLVALLSNLGAREILFIDEIHRMPKHVEEVLYNAMELFAIDMIIGQGAGAKSVRLPLQPFTVIGATTRTSMISAPLQTRFGIMERLDFYDHDDLAQIVLQNAQFLKITMKEDAALHIGKRARGTPRIAKRLLRRVRDYAQVKKYDVIDEPCAHEALNFLGIDEEGLTNLDRDILKVMLLHFDGGPVGLETLAAMTGEDKETIELVCEPFLMRQGFLQKTTRGRQIPAQKTTYLYRRLLNKEISEQKKLFEE